MFVMYRSGQKRKLAAEAKDKQVAMLQLASVRSQLNPHFIFNALAGIQNLMNKNEVENANKYLSRFARLTRNILDDGNKELTSIEKETALLTDYLQMEQTRFGFSFSIDVDANVDQLTEIPAMLLQPFAENAVKHGVSALKDKGIIKISITKQGPDLLLTVQDNGSGFANDQADGMGFKLCRERIALLNTIYKKSSILLKQTSGNAGTLISIELRGWV
ncbi:histidine kinase [Mucilaginibacter myungsuensis]|uniref:Histidine kinase n=2 Tax=Mucilaginibacter myungsuensis TaxID=649104 RepID=A0A929KZ60_9SPHI|nr:histidine kinase [Mucilaginibacter myungsuensis]